MKADFWPNLDHGNGGGRVPVAFASAQLSDRAAARWKKSGATAKVPRAVRRRRPGPGCGSRHRRTALCLARRNEWHRSGRRIAEASCRRVAKPDQGLVTMLRKAAGKRRILLAASTHPGEDEVVIDAAGQLGAGWFTIIAPRHPERGRRSGLYARLPATGPASAAPAHRRRPVTTSISPTRLARWTACSAASDITFLGGSLVPSGGHNPVEPAAYGRPVLSGPHVFKNSAEFGALADAGVVTTIRWRQRPCQPMRRKRLRAGQAGADRRGGTRPRSRDWKATGKRGKLVP